VTYPSIERPRARGPIPTVGFAMAAVIVGCGQEQQSGAAAADACRPPSQVAAMSRADIVAWARTLSYGAADSTRALIYGFAAGDSARIEAVEGEGGTSCVGARLMTRNAYPALGIGAGENYVVVDSASGGYNAVLVAADSSVGMRVHRVATHTHEPGAAPPPRVGSMGMCLRACGREWCRGALDSARTEALARPRDLDLVRSRPPTP
jgi:hypothetical protein